MGTYIAGWQDGRYYKMCKFNGDGTSVTSSGRYKSTYCGVASASELVNLYAGARSVGDKYQFKKGNAFSCQVAQTPAPTGAATTLAQTPAPTAAATTQAPTGEAGCDSFISPA